MGVAIGLVVGYVMAILKMKVQKYLEPPAPAELLIQGFNIVGSSESDAKVAKQSQIDEFDADAQVDVPEVVTAQHGR